LKKTKKEAFLQKNITLMFSLEDLTNTMTKTLGVIK
jgi:hypothetical protein